jgi:hypothetical protein
MLSTMVPSGRYDVKRVSGLLPPFGVTKTIAGDEGCTYFFGVPIGRFRVEGRRFVYRRWPIVDELAPSKGEARETGAPSAPGEDDSRDDTKASRTGAGLLWGRLRFCRFRLEPTSATSRG